MLIAVTNFFFNFTSGRFSHSGSQILKSTCHTLNMKKADDNYNAVISVEVKLWTNQHHSTLMSILLLPAQRLTSSLGPSLSWRCSAGACSCQVGGASLWCLGCWHDDRPTLAINHIMNDKLKPLGKEGQSFDLITFLPPPKNKTKQKNIKKQATDSIVVPTNSISTTEPRGLNNRTVSTGLNNSTQWSQ